MIQFLDGNDCIVRGALQAGCDFYAGYPITPATSILLGMYKFLPGRGGQVIQGEDEIASFSFCIAAAMAGAKCLTATSGPGISLYSESIGLAIMGEVPMVVVDVQRLGPATGAATRTAEGDIQFLRHSTSSGLPVIILAPTDAEDHFPITVKAFNLAEKLRTPVFIATTKDAGLTKARVDLDQFKNMPIENRRGVGEDEPYLPFGSTPSNLVPAFSPFGGKNVTRFTTSSHGPDGYLTKDPVQLQALMDRLTQKILSQSSELVDVIVDEDPQADTLIISYGLASQAAREAVMIARSQGKNISHLTIRSLFPVPEKTIKEALSKVNRVILPELNGGLYRLEIERLAHHQSLVSITRHDGQLLTPEDILTQGELL